MNSLKKYGLLQVDEDSNGEIDFEEFCRCMKRSHNIFKSTAKDEMVRQCFDIFDQDGNGVITRNEFMVSNERCLQ